MNLNICKLNQWKKLGIWNWNTSLVVQLKVHVGIFVQFCQILQNKTSLVLFEQSDKVNICIQDGVYFIEQLCWFAISIGLKSNYTCKIKAQIYST